MKTSPGLLIATGLMATVLLSGCGLFGSGSGNESSPPPGDSSTSPAVVVEPAPVDLDQTFEDTDLGVALTIETVNTSWLPYVAQAGEDTSLHPRMTGFSIKVDQSLAKYLDVTPRGQDFSLIAPDNSVAACAGLLTSPTYQTNTAAILASLGADVAYDPLTDPLAGWIWCFTDTTSDAAFTSAGFTIHYERGAAVSTDGTPIARFTFNLPVSA